MKTEKEKMLAGELYYDFDPELVEARILGRERARHFCEVSPRDSARRRELLSELLGYETDSWIEPPFHCDYGTNIHLGKKVYMNFNCIVLDVAPVTIGDHTMLGPGVQILTASHSLDPEERRSPYEFAKPITIGKDVWIGGGVIVCPGVTIGDRAVIGAGSVVTRDIPCDVVAVGNPARVIKSLLK